VTSRDLAARHHPVPVRPAEPGRPGGRSASRRPNQPAEAASRSWLAADLTSPREARAMVREALAGWGLGAISADAELMTSELVANAAEHAGGSPVRLTICPNTEPNGQRGILCRVTDTSPALPESRQPAPDSERGRGLRIVAELATSSGFYANPRGKTAWFTLAPAPERTPGTRQAEPGT
jgi:anti-sigma regulatory factor (Ser/Thr protein kinase)